MPIRNDYSLPYLRAELLWVTWSCWPAPGHLDTPQRDWAAGFALWWVKSGQITARQLGADGEWKIGPGEVFIWPRRLKRRVEIEAGTEWISCGLEYEFLGQKQLLKNLERPGLLRVKDSELELLTSSMQLVHRLRFGEDVAPYSGDMRSIPEEKRPQELKLSLAQELQCRSLAHLLFALCWAAIDRGESAHFPLPSWLTASLEELQHDPALKVQDLARRSGFSDSQFRRIFSKWMGISPREYLHQFRMDRARAALEHTDVTCGELARVLGYRSLSHFTSAFKTSFGVAPGQYRQKLAPSLNE